LHRKSSRHCIGIRGWGHSLCRDASLRTHYYRSEKMVLWRQDQGKMVCAGAGGPEKQKELVLPTTSTLCGGATTKPGGRAVGRRRGKSTVWARKLLECKLTQWYRQISWFIGLRFRAAPLGCRDAGGTPHRSVPPQGQLWNLPGGGLGCGDTHDPSGAEFSSS